MKVILGDVCGDRDNNFNLIRMIAASAVLVSHAHPIGQGIGAEEPLEELVGRSLGWIAVGVFFAISGFLIARSFDRARRLSDWFTARAMRLFPALIVVVLLTAFVLGPLVTALAVDVYFTNTGVATYIVRNITLAFLQFDLPGVFADNPYPGAINGSLWTLIHEVGCYFGVFVIGILGLFKRRIILTLALFAYFGVYWVVGMPGVVEQVPPMLKNFRDLSLPFAIGIFLYVWRDYIRLSWIISAVLFAVVVLMHGRTGFMEVFLAWLSYTTFLLAYVPGGFIRKYNSLGDYSYGLYIYSFPAQQLAVYLFGSMLAWQNVAIAFPAALLCAIISWYVIESPALASRHKVADLLDRMVFRRFST